MEKNSNKILGVDVQNLTKKDILEKIKKNIEEKEEFLHVTSLNPENLVVATELKNFQNVLNQAQIKIVDGIGVLLGCSILDISCGERITGADLMEEISKMASRVRSRALFIGGRGKIAEELAECYQKKYAQTSSEVLFKGFEAFKDIQNPTEAEKEALFSIVRDYRPRIIFAAFGSPAQEMWFWSDRESLKGIVCMGVGGGFDFAMGQVKRAPAWMRSLGLEWLFRLTIQPWRWKRQLRLFKFVWLVLKQKITGSYV